MFTVIKHDSVQNVFNTKDLERDIKKAEELSIKNGYYKEVAIIRIVDQRILQK